MIDLSNINLLNVIGSDTHLKKVAGTGGGEMAGACPYCGGKDRFKVQPYAKPVGRWMCRQCSPRWSNAIGYLRAKGLSFVEACEYLKIELKPLEKRPSTPRPVSKPQPVTPMGLQQAWLKDWSNNLLENYTIVEYLAKRGIVDPEEYQLGYTGEDTRLKQWMWHKIAIPHIHQGLLTAVKLRNNPFMGGGGYITLSDERDPVIGRSHYMLPYNADALKDSPIAGIIETELDAIACSQLTGVPHVGIPAGAVKRGNQWLCVSWRDYYTDLFLTCERVINWRDNDASGIAFGQALKAAIGRAELYAPSHEHKDMGAWLQADKDGCFKFMLEKITNG